MTGFQKFIKYAAIVFGIYLSITIVLVLLGIANGFVKSSKQSVTEIVENIDESHLKDISQEYTDIANLEIDLENIEFNIKKGENFKIEGTNIPDKIEIRQERNTLKINDDKVSSNFYTVNNALTIYIPGDQKLNNIDIEANSVLVDIETLNAINLKLEIHNNYCKINELFADNLEMSNEYGEIELYKSEVKTLKFDSEAGTEDIHMKITEKAEVNLESSNTNMTLTGSLENYQINHKKLFGTTYVQGKEFSSTREPIGNGNVIINLETEYAELNIDFEEIANESNL